MKFEHLPISLLDRDEVTVTFRLLGCGKGLSRGGMVENPKFFLVFWKLVRRAGIEPATPGLKVRCSAD